MRMSLPIIVSALFWLAVPASADYTLILKNGRQITVQNYREEGRMIKFYGLGGEIGLSRDLIEAIRKSGATTEQGKRVFDVGKKTSPSEDPGIAPSPIERSDERTERSTRETQGVEEDVMERQAIDEAEYRRLLSENAANLKSATEQYISTSRGGRSTIEPSLPSSEHEIAVRTDDLISRSKDEQNRQSGQRIEPAIELPKPAPLSGTAPPLLVPGSVNRVPTVSAAPGPYTDSQKELSDLRNQIYQLESERQKLIEEMKQRNPEPDSSR